MKFSPFVKNQVVFFSLFLEKEVTYRFLCHEKRAPEKQLLFSGHFIMVDPRNRIMFHAMMNWMPRKDQRANIRNTFLRTGILMESVATGYLSILA